MPLYQIRWNFYKIIVNETGICSGLRKENFITNGFNRGDIVKLLVDTSLHNKGSIGIVNRSDDKILEVYFEYEWHPVGCKPEWFKKIDIKWLCDRIK